MSFPCAALSSAPTLQWAAAAREQYLSSRKSVRNSALPCYRWTNLQDGGQRIGSSVIRRLLIEEGNVTVANDMLARPYSLSGIVQEGHKRGKDLGFPTANISVPARRAVPADGIYVTRAHLGDRVLESVTNIGDNPTFHDQERMIETFILDFDEDLYGQTIGVEFLERLRGEVEFTTVDALVEQMHLDVQQTRAYFARNA